MFNFDLFLDAVIGGVPLLPVILGLVQLVKGFGLEGNAVKAVSMVIGLLFGGAFVVSQGGMPADFGGWFALVVYGLGMGLVSSGIYDVGKGLADRAGVIIAGVDDEA